MLKYSNCICIGHPPPPFLQLHPRRYDEWVILRTNRSYPVLVILMSMNHQCHLNTLYWYNTAFIEAGFIRGCPLQQHLKLALGGP